MKSTWVDCNNTINSEYNGFNPGSVLLYPNLLTSGIRILIFNGDNDSVCPINGNLDSIKWMEENAGLTIVDYWRPWFKDNN